MNKNINHKRSLGRKIWNILNKDFKFIGYDKRPINYNKIYDKIMEVLGIISLTSAAITLGYTGFAVYNNYNNTMEKEVDETERVIQKYDSNKDGSLDKQELSNLLKDQL